MDTKEDPRYGAVISMYQKERLVQDDLEKYSIPFLSMGFRFPNTKLMGFLKTFSPPYSAIEGRGEDFHPRLAVDATHTLTPLVDKDRVVLKITADERTSD